jgi:hypothetical protein
MVSRADDEVQLLFVDVILLAVEADLPPAQIRFAVACNHREIARGLVMESLSEPRKIFRVRARERPSHAGLALVAAMPG